MDIMCESGDVGAEDVPIRVRVSVTHFHTSPRHMKNSVIGIAGAIAGYVIRQEFANSCYLFYLCRVFLLLKLLNFLHGETEQHGSKMGKAFNLVSIG